MGQCICILEGFNIQPIIGLIRYQYIKTLLNLAFAFVLCPNVLPGVFVCVEKGCKSASGQRVKTFRDNSGIEQGFRCLRAFCWGHIFHFTGRRKESYRAARRSEENS